MVLYNHGSTIYNICMVYTLHFIYIKVVSLNKYYYYIYSKASKPEVLVSTPGCCIYQEFNKR